MNHLFLYLLALIFLSNLSCNIPESPAKVAEPAIANDSKRELTDSVPQTSEPTGALYTSIGLIPVPDGYERIPVEEDSFGHYLRSLPLKTEDNRVYLFNGTLKHTQNVHYAVLTMDVGKKDLQQCADAVMRLRAEYLWHSNRKAEIHFNFESGDKAVYLQYVEGIRPVIKGNKVSWVNKAARDTSYAAFRNYMDLVFMYAGTASLSKELIRITPPDSLNIGDVFIKGGYPGHAVLIVDVAINKKTGKKIFMMTQSYMPAQEIHILKNFNERTISPWYSTDNAIQLYTPEWTFSWNELSRFK